jgi:sulfane dehydrogenase subunit SoxC
MICEQNSMRDNSDEDLVERQIAAGNGLLHRRALLGRGIVYAGALAAGSTASPNGAAAEPLAIDFWSRTPGGAIVPYGQPAAYEKDVVRTLTNPKAEIQKSAARTPLHRLGGIITPNGLHYVVAQGGIPDIDPAKHRLLIHGLVKRPIVFTTDALLRYPMTSQISFLECGGNSAALYAPKPVQADVQTLHGLCSCAEWTGVKLATLLQEAGIDPEAKWLIAEGADLPNMSRSIALAKIIDDAMVALYQNGERLNPANGYPMRLLLPGYEGSASIKWLRRIKIVDASAMSINDIKRNSMPLPEGESWEPFFPQEVKSFITRPSPGLELKEPGYYEISGLAFSGSGKIDRVDVSADGGKSWAQAALQEPVLSKAFTRFRAPWHWNGGPAILQSRAKDSVGNVQPTRAALVAKRGQLEGQPSISSFSRYGWNAITSWSVSSGGEISHVYA